MQHILLIDDDLMTLEFMKLYLESEGYSVATASNEVEAREQFCNQKPHIILSDIELGDCSGTELAKYFRTQGIDQLIGITGYSNDFLMRHNAHAFFDSILTKPIDFGALKKALQSENQTLRS